MIKEEDVDILGIQEALPNQIDYLSNQLKDYNYIGKGRNGGNSGEYSAIYFKSEKISLKEEETFWLSETPRVPSIGWDAAINRIVTLGVFYIKNSKKELISKKLDGKKCIWRKTAYMLYKPNDWIL